MELVSSSGAGWDLLRILGPTNSGFSLRSIFTSLSHEAGGGRSPNTSREVLISFCTRGSNSSILCSMSSSEFELLAP